jgi:hypothetical protein
MEMKLEAGISTDQFCPRTVSECSSYRVNSDNESRAANGVCV